MLNPNYLLHISEGAENIAEKLHNDIISRIVERVMLRIGRGDDYILTAQDKWQIEKLQDAGYLLEDIQQDIAKATKLQQTEIAEAMEDAGVQALDYDDKIYRDAGLAPTPLTQSPQLIRIMQRNYEATLGEWSNFTRTTAEQAQRLFLSELDHAYNLVSTGALSYTAAVKEVINRIVSDGVTVTYPTGHTDTIETATLRAVRTGISQATGQIQTARMDEMGVDLVITSSHLGARPSHQAWQGMVFSRSGRNPKYLPFKQTTGYGTVEGLCGANCRHSFGPYFEGMDNPFEQYNSKENLEQYQKEQRQRTLERRIRDTKREVLGLKKSLDGCEDDTLYEVLDKEYQRKSALLAKQNKAYKDYCEKNGLKPLQDRLQIAQWNRKQAAAARGAARRYKNAKIASIKNQTAEKVLSYDDIKNKIEDYERKIQEINEEKKKATLDVLLNPSEDNVAKGKAANEKLKNLNSEYDKFKEKYSSKFEEIQREKERVSKEELERQERIKREKMEYAIDGVEKGKPMTFDEANHNRVNPNFEKDYDCKRNCQSCVVTYEARLRGFDVQARPKTSVTAYDLSHDTNMAWIDPITKETPISDVLDIVNISDSDFYDWIYENMEEDGRYTFRFNWKGGGTSGHIISAQRTKDGFMLYDPQNGKIITERISIEAYLSRINTDIPKTIMFNGLEMPNPAFTKGMPNLLRVDDLEINMKIANEIMEAVKK